MTVTIAASQFDSIMSVLVGLASIGLYSLVAQLILIGLVIVILIAVSAQRV